MPGRATIHEVARKAGVAASTVSRAFNAPHLLRPATVASVKQVSEQLGYVPNLAARALNTGRSGLLGLIVPDLSAHGTGAMVHRLQQEAEEAGLTVVTLDTRHDAERERRQISALVAHCEGLVIVSSALAAPELQLVADQGRVVLVNSDIDRTARVLVSPQAALTDLVERLVSAGRTAITYVPAPTLDWAEQERRRVLQALADKGTITLQVTEANDLPDAGAAVIRHDDEALLAPVEQTMHEAFAQLRPGTESAAIGLPEARIVLTPGE